MKTFEEMEKDDIKANPYSVVHDEALGRPLVFKTWVEALQAQKEWNKEVQGHKAIKRKYA